MLPAPVGPYQLWALYLGISCLLVNPAVCVWMRVVVPKWLEPTLKTFQQISVFIICCSLALNSLFVTGAGQHDGWSHDQRQWSLFWHWQIPRARWYDSRVFWAVFMAPRENCCNCWSRQVFLNIFTCYCLRVILMAFMQRLWLYHNIN